MEPSIEGLITLTETVEDPLAWNNVSENTNNHDQPADQTSSMSKDFPQDPLSVKPQENFLGFPNLNYEPTLPAKSEKPKRGAARNRMGSFCGNIAKLKSSSENNTRNNETLSVKESASAVDDNFFFDDMPHYGASSTKIFREATSNLTNFGNLPDVIKPTKSTGIYAPAGKHKDTIPANWVKRDQKNSRGTPSADSNRREPFLDTKQAAEDKEFNKPGVKVAALDNKSNMRKNESESLCGLKVQYRLSGMESSSDDDADVVIEDESSDYKINPASSMSISVCQFLSPSTQTPPQRTQPEIHMINTPSPPQTPQRSVHDATLNRIKAAIQRGSKIMILLRGLQGSGKSTLAKSIVATTVGGNSAAYVFNTDDFFVTLGRGVYQFDPTRLQEAHNTNHKRVWNALKEGRSPVIVDNTNIEAWEMRPYAAMAVENGYIVEILEPNTPWAQNVNELAKKNTHNVPKSTIRDKYQRYERGLTGKKLLDKYSLKYSKKNIPPQLRKVPPISTDDEPRKVAPTMSDFKSNWGLNDKNNFVLTSRDIESMQNIDESHCSIGLISECASVADDSSNTLSNPEKASNHGDKDADDYLQELQDSDESFEMLDSGASLHPSDAGVSLDESQLDIPTHTPDETAEEYVADTKYSSPNGSQQILGAIGSERKGSLSVAPSVGNPEVQKPESIELEKNDNVLSQCWNFTLRRQNTDEHESDPLPSERTMPQSNITDESEEDIARNSEVQNELDQKYDQLIDTKESVVENVTRDDDGAVTEVTKSPETALEINEDHHIDAEIASAEWTEDNIEIDSTLLCDALNTEDRIDKSPETCMELVEEPTVPSAFGTFFKKIFVILKPHEDDSARDGALQFENDKDNDKDAANTATDMGNQDTVDFPGKSDDGEQPPHPELDLITLSPDLNGENIYPDLSTNPFRKEMLESQLVDDTNRDCQSVNDNMNSISWKESPFPTDAKMPFPLDPPLEHNKSVSKIDASTNTSYYDFNVSYVGGTSEPGYRELSATSRCINEENFNVAKIERPPLKLMLHKSSMTSEANILAAESNANPEKAKDSDDGIQKLIELFPDIPIESLTAFYVQQCKRNFEWAVDVLMDDASNGFILKGLEMKRPTVENDAATGGACIDNDKKWKIDNEKLKQRSHSSSPRHRRKKNKDFRSFSVDFADNRNWHSGESANTAVEISRVRDVDEDDVIFQHFYDDAVSKPCLPTEPGEIPETSSEEENEEEIELNFGREFINQLEKSFGNPDFAFPDEFTPAIRIKKSMAEELHARWIQSMYRQLNARHAQLDEMIKKGEAKAYPP